MELNKTDGYSVATWTIILTANIKSDVHCNPQNYPLSLSTWLAIGVSGKVYHYYISNVSADCLEGVRGVFESSRTVFVVTTSVK
jgi:hypothetical protein